MWTVISRGMEKEDEMLGFFFLSVMSSWRREGNVVDAAAAAVSGLEAPRWMLLQPPPA